MNNWKAYFWNVILFIFTICLFIYAFSIKGDINARIAILGIVGIIITAFTTVHSVVLNHKNAKEREIELMIVKEKIQVFEHFYNAYFEFILATKNSSKHTDIKAEKEMIAFKRGLMNWGSETIIKAYHRYEDSIIEAQLKNNTKQLFHIGDDFLKAMRKEIGLEISKDTSILSLVLTPEARRELEGKTK